MEFRNGIKIRIGIQQHPEPLLAGFPLLGDGARWVPPYGAPHPHLKMKPTPTEKQTPLLKNELNTCVSPIKQHWKKLLENIILLD